MKVLVPVLILIVFTVDLSLGQVGDIRDGIKEQAEKFISGVASNQCKFSIAYFGKNVRGQNGFDTQWETEDGDINHNHEVLGGIHHSVDTSRETLSSAGRLAKVRFWPFGNSATCIKLVIIACGSDAVSGGGGYVRITRQNMEAAWIRKGQPRHVASEPENDCVRFNRKAHYYGFKAMDIGRDIFKCDDNDDYCKHLHLEMF